MDEKIIYLRKIVNVHMVKLLLTEAVSGLFSHAARRITFTPIGPACPDWACLGITVFLISDSSCTSKRNLVIFHTFSRFDPHTRWAT